MPITHQDSDSDSDSYFEQNTVAVKGPTQSAPPPPTTNPEDSSEYEEDYEPSMGLVNQNTRETQQQQQQQQQQPQQVDEDEGTKKAKKAAKGASGGMGGMGGNVIGAGNMIGGVKIPRPMNAFMLFRKDVQPGILEEFKSHKYVTCFLHSFSSFISPTFSLFIY
jgi:hypothetical protein